LRPQTASARRAALCRRSQLLRCRHKGYSFNLGARRD
jgi:hypothetical protein